MGQEEAQTRNAQQEDGKSRPGGVSGVEKAQNSFTRGPDGSVALQGRAVEAQARKFWLSASIAERSCERRQTEATARNRFWWQS